MKISKELVAKAIRNYRTLHNMTQVQLAEKLGVADRQIKRWEKAKTLPSHLATRALIELKVLTFDRE